MKVIIFYICLFIFLSPELVWSADQIRGSLNTDVQLQENGYIKIIGQPQVVRTYSRVSKETKKIEVFELPESDNEEGNDALMERYDFKKGDIFLRQLIVFFQFLKPCTTKSLAAKDTDDLYRLVFEVPSFTCDYRFKVFVTFFSSNGDEVATKGEYPIAYWTDSRQLERKLEMLPGEKSQLSFLIPKDYALPRVASWKAWVPK